MGILSLGKRSCRRCRVHVIVATVTICLALLSVDRVYGQSAADILQASAVSNGLCVYLGDNEPGIADELHNGQRLLVDVLCVTEKAVAANRQRLIEKGLYGLVSAEIPRDWTALPFADDMVNLLVVESLPSLQAAGLTVEELDRILVPRGKLVVLNQGLSKSTASAGVQSIHRLAADLLPVVSNGAMSVLTKAAAAGSDDWTHWNHGPEGNAVSQDVNVKPPTYLKWTSGSEWIDPKSGPYTGIRIANGRVFYHHTPQWGTGASEITARDAFNGTLLWRRTDSVSTCFRTVFIADSTRLYTVVDGKYLAARSAINGNFVKIYTNAPLLEPTQNSDEVDYEALLCGGKLITTDGRNHLYALDPTSGNLLWTYTADATDQFVNFICASATEKKAFAVLTKQHINWRLNRWPFTKSLDAIVGIDLETGKELWRNKDLVGKGVGPLMYDKGNIGLFCPYAIGGMGWPDSSNIAGVLRASDGERLWSFNIGEYHCGHDCGLDGYSMVMRGDKMYTTDQSSVVEFTIANGNWRQWNYNGIAEGGNQRCAKGMATSNYLTLGYVTWIDNNWNYQLQPIRRSGCAMPGFPAQGLTYFSPATCGCIPELDGGKGYVALGSEGSRAVADPWNLQPSSVEKNWKLSGEIVPPTSVLRKSLADERATLRGPVVQDWPENRRATGGLAKSALTSSFFAGGYEFRPGAGGLLTDIYKDARLLWTLVTCGRVALAPVVVNDTAFVGGRDGRLYACDLRTGSIVWQYDVAPEDRRIMVSSQLESRWPVTSVSLDNGIIAVKAGRHPALGDIFTAGLDPATGRLLWKKREFVPQNGILASPEKNYVISEERRELNGPQVPRPRPDAPVAASRPARNAVIAVTGDLVSIRLDGVGPIEFSVTNMAGQVMAREKGIFGGTVRLPYSSLRPGRYLLTLTLAGKKQVKSFAVKKWVPSVTR